MFIPISPITTFTQVLSSQGSTHLRLFGGSNAWLYASGRAALLAGLRLLPRGGPCRIWIPAYLCRSLLPPIEACGFKALLYDITDQLQPQFEAITPEAGDAVLVVHYFGIAQGMEPVRAFCKARGLFLIEDCAHALPDPSSSIHVGSYGDLAFFSLRKQLPVPDGGVLMVNSSVIGQPSSDHQLLTATPVALRAILTMVAHRIAFQCGWNILPLKDRLRPVVGSAEPPDPLNDDHGPSSMTRHLLSCLDWESLIQKKKENYRSLLAILAGIPGVDLPIASPPEGSVPQVFPIWVSDPASVSQRLRARGIDAFSWPGTELLPNIDLTLYRGTATWHRRNLCLPIHQNLAPRHIEWMARCVQETIGRHDGCQANPVTNRDL